MNKQLVEKLKTLPREPGVYFHKSKSGEVIYVGKAAVLKNRVRQYFQSTRPFDPKTLALVAEIYDTDWITVETELDALFLESEMIKRYKPRYNILLRDDKSQMYIRIPMKDTYPSVTFTRGPLDDGAEYFGPYYNPMPIRKALKYLRKVFPYSTHEFLPKRVCLQYHLGLCPGVEEGRISEKDYKTNLKRLMLYLRGSRKQLVSEIEKEMKALAKTSEFEKAAERRNQLNNLRALQKQIIFSDKEFMDLSKDEALVGLKELLTLPELPRRIEGYDISHMQGTNNVASMVVATNGLADKAHYRKFKMRIPGNNDFAHMHETISRRFSYFQGPTLEIRESLSNKDFWKKIIPDLLLVDGGKGQLSSALTALEERGLKVPTIGLAKREEEIVIHKTRSNVNLNEDYLQLLFPTLNSRHSEVVEATSSIIRTDESKEVLITGDSEDFLVIRLPKESHIIKLLQRIRNESHRFAVSYHTHLKRTGQVKSVLDDIPGVGPSTKKKLLKIFGSVAGIRDSEVHEVAAVVGLVKAKAIKAHLVYK